LFPRKIYWKGLECFPEGNVQIILSAKARKATTLSLLAVWNEEGQKKEKD